MKTIDLNSDLGEGFGAWSMGDDAAMLEIVSSANVACGFHAGDPLIMDRVVRDARSRGVAIGAHPGFQDLWGFGRRTIVGDRPDEIAKMVLYQIGALQGIAAAAGCRVTHVKPHGALYNLAAESDDLADALGRAIRDLDPTLTWVVLPGQATERAGERLGLPLAREVFADRGYEDDGTLRHRSLPGALIHDPEVAAQRVLRMVEDQAVTSVNGVKVPVRIDTICVHGDNPAAVAMARTIRATLEAAGITIAPFARPMP